MNTWKHLTLYILLFTIAGILLHFFWMPYVGHTTYTLRYSITRLAFYMLVPLPILLFLTACANQPMRFLWHLWFPFFVFRILCDVIIQILINLTGLGWVIIPYTLDSLHILSSGYCWHRSLNTNKTEQKTNSTNKRFHIWFLFLMLTGLVIFAQLQLCNRIINRYTQDSQTFHAALANAAIPMEAGAAMVTLLSVLISCRLWADTLLLDSSLSRYGNSWLVLLPTFCILLVGGKWLIHNDYSLSRIANTTHQYNLENHLGMSGSHYISEHFRLSIQRQSSDGSLCEDSFKKITIFNKNREKLLTSFLFVPPKEATFYVEQLEVGLYAPYWLLIREGDTSYFFAIDELSRTEENPNLTAVLKQLVQIDDFSLFPQSAAYLAKHDPLLITPYLEQYATGKLTIHQQEMLGDLSLDDLRKTALRLLKGI